MKHWKNSLGYLLASQMLVASGSQAAQRNLNTGPSSHLRETPGPGKDDAEPAIRTAQKIAQAYGHVLECSAPLPGCVADASQLPYDKDTIKQALAICLSANNDPHLTRHLKHSYLQLAAWQYGVGDETLGLDFTRIDLEGDPADIAALVQQRSAAMAWWDKLIKDEQATLEADLRTLGFQDH